MQLPNFIQKFQNVQQANGQFTARCPCHDDQQNSLTIGEGEDGRIVLHCHAKCATADIVRAVGCKFSDLFPEQRVTLTAPKSNIVATYDYCDANGQLLYQACRLEPKSFRQRRPHGDGWLWNMDGVTKVPYRLRELLGAERDAVVFVVEGEKDADQLAMLDLVASTNVGGAGKWQSSYNEYFRDRHVCILPDNDSPGLAHAETVARSLQEVAATVKVVVLDGLPPKGDVSDWLALAAR